jgi:hypothetical protein
MRIIDLPEYQSPWLSATDLKGRPVRVTIREWSFQEVRQRDGSKVRKVALTFAGKAKLLLLNSTQGKVLDQAFGELERWIGKTIILQPGRTPQGQQTIEIVAMPSTASPASAPGAPAAAASDGGKVEHDTQTEDNPFLDNEPGAQS